MHMNRLALLAAVVASATLSACDTARPLGEQQSSATDNPCAKCHGYPPTTTTSGAAHPASTDCNACHPTSVDPSGNVIPASAGGTHANGHVDVTSGHPADYNLPANHGPDALTGLAVCKVCHGDTLDGGSGVPSCNACHSTAGFDNWQSNCTFCHGKHQQAYSGVLNDAAPPQGVHGETLATDPHVGAHQRHLVAGTYANPIACATCHAVPSDLTHVDGKPATVTFSGVASGGSFGGGSCTTYCHGATLPGASGTKTTLAWTDSGITCTWCHSTNPTTGHHQTHLSRGYGCSTCHGANYSSTSVVNATHVNGTVEKTAVVGWNGDGTCSPGCHGKQTW
jgi:hypothetical protein